MSDVAEIHELKETLSVDIEVPGHDPRVTTPLFTKSRLHLIERDKCCWICGAPHSKAAPLQAHHFPVERSMAEMINWSEGSIIRKDFPSFGWGSFDEANPYTFVDDMNVNGLLLCEAHHIGKDEGIHDLPHPLWVAQRYGKDGYKFSGFEIIHHE